MFYAVVDVQGFQMKVEPGKKLFINRLAGEKGDQLSFDKVMLVCKDDAVTVGTPYVENAKVVCEILDNECRAKKILVFHKKRRKGYKKMRGHRQDLTNVLVKDILV